VEFENHIRFFSLKLVWFIACFFVFKYDWNSRSSTIKTDPSDPCFSDRQILLLENLKDKSDAAGQKIYGYLYKLFKNVISAQAGIQT
jgi:hypothetical protein